MPRLLHLRGERRHAQRLGRSLELAAPIVLTRRIPEPADAGAKCRRVWRGCQPSVHLKYGTS